MHRLVALLGVTLFSGCATWIHETEIPEVLPAWKFAGGATAAINSTPVAPRQNFPPTSVTRNTYDIYPSLRLSLGKNFEINEDMVLYSSGQRSSGSYFINNTFPYDWIDRSKGKVWGFDISESFGKKSRAA